MLDAIGKFRDDQLHLHDLTVVASLAGMTPLSWMVAEARWSDLARRIARVHEAVRGNRRKRVGVMRKVLGDGRVAKPFEDIADEFAINLFMERLQLLRCHRPGGWHPDLRLQGRGHLDEALAAGRGAILWISPLVFSDLGPKMALSGAGYRVSHLSRYQHNLSDSRLGAALINPITTSVERRHLKERVVIGHDGRVGSLKPLEALRRRLDAGGVISAKVLHTGKRTMPVPLFDVHVSLATGVPHLAIESTAPLLPVFTVREPTGALVTHIEPPLMFDPGIERSARIGAVLRQYTGLLERYIPRYPDQVRWRGMKFDDAGGLA